MNAIIELERAAAKHWRGTEEEWLGGWLLRATGSLPARPEEAAGDTPGAAGCFGGP